MLIFTPELCPPASDPIAVLAGVLPALDAIQVRVKDPELGTTPARASCDWTRRVLELVERARSDALVLVNDRVDVAAALAAQGVDGVHLGAEDAPWELARRLLGPDLLIGLSTHAPAEVVLADDFEIDYLGFGPIHATATKGYERGLGSDAAWVAARASSRPLFPIGGIDAVNAGELAEVGRAAVGRAILAARDPLRVAREIAGALARG
jgi:thiamine-phosphate pyrophosphorylase